MAWQQFSVVTLSTVLAGCAFAPPPEPEKITFEPINFIVPSEGRSGPNGTAALEFQPQFTVLRKDSTSELFRRDAVVSGDSIRITNQSFLSDRRVKSDGPGAEYRPYEEIGIEYELRCLSHEQDKSMLLSCGLTNRKMFNNAGFSFKGRLDARAFTTEELSHYLRSSVSVGYTVEIDSPYNSESTLAKFHRLLKQIPSDSDGRDSVTGKIYKARYAMPYQDRELSLSVQVFPYRNGSRAVITTSIPGAWSGAHSIDFSRSVEAVKERLKNIVNA